jgi:hypothetical protein
MDQRPSGIALTNESVSTKDLEDAELLRKALEAHQRF